MRFSAATLLRVALCASSVHARILSQADAESIDEQAALGDYIVAIEASNAPRTDLPPSASVSLMGQKDADGHFIVDPDLEDEDGQDLQGRAVVMTPPIVLVVGPILVKVLTAWTVIAINAAVSGLFAMRKWKPTRAQFTQDTVKRMWEDNPNPNLYAAAICYSRGYGLQRPDGIIGKVRAKLVLGILSTEYDCMYMEGGNEFWTWSDGGYINLAYKYDRNRCTFIKENGDLHCR